MTPPYSAAVDGGLLLAFPFRPGWLAIGFYTVIDAALHLADLSIIPGEIPPEPQMGDPPFDRMTPARWIRDGRYLTHARKIQAIEHARPRGVYARVLREVPLNAMQHAAEKAARELDEFARTLRAAKAPAHVTDFAESLRPALTSLTGAHLQYLRAAQAFARSWQTKSNAEIAAELRCSTDELHNWLSAARKAGYLTSPGQGRRGGELTPEGKTLARRHLTKEATK